uniref:Uncharacterized protein n=1 Tax=Glossina brevipalpis TaxID=37001 RepID=A0A1A9W142_9MUSC
MLHRKDHNLYKIFIEKRKKLKTADKKPFTLSQILSMQSAMRAYNVQKKDLFLAIHYTADIHLAFNKVNHIRQLTLDCIEHYKTTTIILARPIAPYIENTFLHNKDTWLMHNKSY